MDLVLGPVKLSKAFSRQNIARCENAHHPPDKALPPELLCAAVLSDVRQHVEAPGESSSGTSNLVERCLAVVWACSG